MRQRSKHEEKFALLWRALKGPVCESEVRFHPERKWRFDFAVCDKRIAIEIEGGVWKGGKGGHTSGVGYTNNCEKYNEAALMGWTVFRLTPSMINADIVERIIAKAKEN